MTDEEFEQHIQRTDRRITEVFYFPNGMVAVTDQFGQQMPEYQGRATPELVKKIKEVMKYVVITCSTSDVPTIGGNPIPNLGIVGTGGDRFYCSEPMDFAQAAMLRDEINFENHRATVKSIVVDVEQLYALNKMAGLNSTQPHSVSAPPKHPPGSSSPGVSGS